MEYRMRLIDKDWNASKWRLACLAILLLAAGVYMPTLSGMPIWEDSRLIGGYDSIQECFTKPFLGDYFRPLTALSFYIDHALSGHEPFLYHQTNILIHVLTTAVLIGLFLAAFRSRAVALLGALLFAVQPAQVSTVAWIGGRTDSLCALWVALFGWGLVTGIQADERKRTWRLGIAWLAFGAAILTKEQSL